MRHLRRAARVALGALVLLTAASPALACKTDGSSFDLDHCWSTTRVGLWVVLLLPAAFASFLVFQRALEPGRADPPWPRTAFGRAVALFWGLGGLAFLVLFAAAGDELRSGRYWLPPGGWFGTFLNNNWPLLLVLAVTVGGAWLIVWTVRHHDKTGA
jgi:hypothetical protein